MDRLKELDVLRGFAALNVMLYHYTSRYFELFNIKNPIQYEWYFGHHGVELFFMISGFVIFMSLQNIKNIKDFVLKRAIRLYPVYWICILITLSFSIFFSSARSADFSFFQILMNLTMIQGIFEIPNIDGVYWSLLPELFFYTLMGALYYFNLLKHIKLIGLFWLVWMILNKAGILPYGEFFLNLQYGMFFLAGILFYNLKFNNSGLLDRFLIISCLFTAFYVHGLSYNLYIYPIFFWIFNLFVQGKLRIFNWSPLLVLGSISYPLYLLHQNIGYALISDFYAFLPNYTLVIFLTISLMILLAYLVKKYLEDPVSQYLKQKLIVNKKVEEKTFIEKEVPAFSTKNSH